MKRKTSNEKEKEIETQLRTKFWSLHEKSISKFSSAGPNYQINYVLQTFLMHLTTKIFRLEIREYIAIRIN